MKNKVLSMLVLLMMAATGAWAQSTYKVTMKEGTEDATNWTITPNPATAGTQVKATYGGTKRVKSVKAVKKVNPLATPLTIEALEDGSRITVSNPNGMQYSTDGGITKTAVSDGIDITLEKAGDKVQFYGTATAYGESETTIDGSGSLKVYGNIMSLVDEEGFATNTTLTAPFTFTSLFQGNHSLTDASGLLLPATTLKESCYESMFSGCTSLVAGPNLPATTLKEFCYASMFLGCTSLVAGPNLPATTLQPYCYRNMFSYCTSLVAGPNLPATTLKEFCYASMFLGCTSLVAGPNLPATTLTKYCYSYMFSGCTSLTSLTCLATNIYASGCIDHWLNGVTTTGTLYVDESMTEVNWNLPNDDWSVTEKP